MQIFDVRAKYLLILICYMQIAMLKQKGISCNTNFYNISPGG